MLTAKKKQLITEYSLTFNSEAGKNVLADLRKKCLLVDRSLLQCNPTLEPAMTAYLEGERAVLLYIFKMLKIDPYAERSSHAINLDPQEQI